ncbi:MAG: hypothetical protein Q9M91_02700 [Candidatus Dojkabacteria bacterium]|nr:hypothetical protein [Candidatus Dojkabacteria bacterium]MDQ7020734.1 hypothetical protein [Candidatus Dojkabacteria bacterium]
MGKNMEWLNKEVLKELNKKNENTHYKLPKISIYLNYPKII